MRDQNRRLSKLERSRQALETERVRDTWRIPIIETDDSTDPAWLEQELERIAVEARAAGWRPESGRPSVVVVYLDRSDPIEPTELESDELP